VPGPAPIDAPAWWRETVVYQIYPRSFCDSDGDGIGDLDGITSKLDYLADLGVETLWISPFYASPQADFGYDVSDFRAVAPEYGDLAAWDRLVAAARERGLRLVLDMVLNHTSDQHPWFQASRSSRDDPKRDWYVWRDGKKPGGKAPPTNWRAMIGKRGWHYDPATDQWYWAQFLPFQPDLDYRNPAVQEEMLDTLRFWMSRGADGFRLDIINALFEDPELRDNPFAWKLLPSEGDMSMLFQRLAHSLDHPDTVAFAKVLRETVDGFDARQRFLVGEVIAHLPETKAMLGGERADGLHLAFQFQALGLPLKASRIRALIEEFEAELAEPLLPTWVFSNHDRARRISRLGGDPAKAKLNLALQLTARGVPFLYYGEEIGMLQARFPIKRSLDAVAQPFAWIPQFVLELARWWTGGESINRDECRTPMQWTPGPSAGFSTHDATWLPLGPEHETRNVETQLADPDSLLHCTRRFLHARSASPALRGGALELLEDPGEPRGLLRYRRVAADDTAWVYLNVSRRVLQAPAPPPGSRCVVSTHAEPPDLGPQGLALRPWEGVVFGG